MAETTASQVAENLIAFQAAHGDTVSNLKLQKLLYYSQAWYLALYDKPLFDDRIEAWTHGPAVPPVYGSYKAWQWNPIPPPDASRKMPDHVEGHLHEVLAAYGNFSAYQLELLTHQEDPWIKARKGLPPEEPSNNIITHDDMKIYYRKRIDEQQNQAG